MMPQRNPSCLVVDQSGPDLPPSCCQVECASEVAAKGVQRNRGAAASSSPENGSVNGDGNGKRSGKSRRRRKRSAQPDNQPAPIATETQPPPPSPVQQKGDGLQPSHGGSSHAPPTLAPAFDYPLLSLRSECGSVWLDRSVYEQAESQYQSWLVRSAYEVTPRSSSSPSPVNLAASNHLPIHPASVAEGHHFVAEPLQRAAPDLLAFLGNSPATPVTPDEGYLSLAQTPQTATPSALTPASGPGQPLNGLPRLPLELLRGVWLEKPLYDRAEVNFYQSLGCNRSPDGNNLGRGASTTRSTPSAPLSSRSSGHPQSLVEEEEEDEDVEEAVVVTQGIAEVSHSLRTIQEEEEPADVTVEEGVSKSMGGVCYFLHPGSEKVWLDRGRYEAAERHFYGYLQNIPAESTEANRKGLQDAGVSETLLLQPPSTTVANTGPPRDKYDPS